MCPPYVSTIRDGAGWTQREGNTEREREMMGMRLYEQSAELVMSHLSPSPSGKQSKFMMLFDDATIAGKSREEADGTHFQQQAARLSSLLALLLAVLKFKRSHSSLPRQQKDGSQLDIGSPTHVQHITHVTFDRFRGFLGLPPEFQHHIPYSAPSASASVFGVSTSSMQCSYDGRGNSVPTILLKIQERLYEEGGLKAEGIFRINGENSQEEHVRSQLNKGFIPRDVDVHCLAGLIKAWFRELPGGVLDSLCADHMAQCHSEQQCLALVKILPPTDATLLDWAINLMADVVEEEQFNKMNARNIAMVFAPNMTQMSDPLTALMHAVHVMNFLKTLTLKTLRDRQESSIHRHSKVNVHQYSSMKTACLVQPKKQESGHDCVGGPLNSFITNELNNKQQCKAACPSKTLDGIENHQNNSIKVIVRRNLFGSIGRKRHSMRSNSKAEEVFGNIEAW